MILHVCMRLITGEFHVRPLTPPLDPAGELMSPKPLICQPLKKILRHQNDNSPLTRYDHHTLQRIGFHWSRVIHIAKRSVLYLK